MSGTKPEVPRVVDMTERSARVIVFDPLRRRQKKESKPERTFHAPQLITGDESADPLERVVAVVTVTRFIDGKKVHAQYPIFANELRCEEAMNSDANLIPELSELLADGAVEANSFLDRFAAALTARPAADFRAG